MRTKTEMARADGTRRTAARRNGPGAEPATVQDDHDIYLSPRELAARWKCARSTAARIVSDAGLTKVLLGEGKNGMVRYLKEEVVAYEDSRRT